MTDDELIKEFIRVDRTGSETTIAVCKIQWDGPHTPVSNWKIAASFPAETTDDNVATVVAGILRDRHFFQVCTECNERKPNGWMMGNGTPLDSICQSCGERHHGVIF